MKQFPTPTLDKIAQMKKAGTWPAKDGESIDPTSLDDKMRDILLLGTLELVGLQLFELNSKFPKPPEPIKSELVKPQQPAKYTPQKKVSKK